MRKLSAILIFMLLLAACGGVNEPPPSPTEAATIEPAPIETAVPDPTAELVAPVAEESEIVVDEQPTEMPIEAESETAVTNTDDFITFQLEAWADNWFATYLGEELIVEDSVSITTERSFNAETGTFEASYPLNLNFILKDFCLTSDDLGPNRV